eukprot:364447-Chlamydomonas_euryale.AAC.15
MLFLRRFFVRIGRNSSAALDGMEMVCTHYSAALRPAWRAAWHWHDEAGALPQPLSCQQKGRGTAAVRMGTAAAMHWAQSLPCIGHSRLQAWAQPLPCIGHSRCHALGTAADMHGHGCRREWHPPTVLDRDVCPVGAQQCRSPGGACQALPAHARNSPPARPPHAATAGVRQQLEGEEEAVLQGGRGRPHNASPRQTPRAHTPTDLTSLPSRPLPPLSASRAYPSIPQTLLRAGAPRWRRWLHGPVGCTWAAA